jgi:hypothetical protein
MTLTHALKWLILYYVSFASIKKWFKKYIYFLTGSVRQELGHMLDESLAQGVARLPWRCWPYFILLRSLTRKYYFQNSLNCWLNSFPCSHGTHGILLYKASKTNSLTSLTQSQLLDSIVHFWGSAPLLDLLLWSPPRNSYSSFNTDILKKVKKQQPFLSFSVDFKKLTSTKLDLLLVAFLVIAILAFIGFIKITDRNC